LVSEIEFKCVQIDLVVVYIVKCEINIKPKDPVSLKVLERVRAKFIISYSPCKERRRSGIRERAHVSVVKELVLLYSNLGIINIEQ
jgi:hypothetical protein